MCLLGYPRDPGHLPPEHFLSISPAGPMALLAKMELELEALRSILCSCVSEGVPTLRVPTTLLPRGDSPSVALGMTPAPHTLTSVLLPVQILGSLPFSCFPTCSSQQSSEQKQHFRQEGNTVEAHGRIFLRIQGWPVTRQRNQPL